MIKVKHIQKLIKKPTFSFLILFHNKHKIETRSIYLGIVGEVGFENVLDVGGVGRVNLAPERSEQSVSLVARSKISHVIVQSAEVQELVHCGAAHRMIPPSLSSH